MSKRSLEYGLLCFAAVVVASTNLFPRVDKHGEEDTRRDVVVRTARNEYLLGEPVVVQVTFTNRRKQETKVPEMLSAGLEPEIPVYIDGLRFRFGYPIGDVSVPAITLQPGASWSYRLLIGYGYLGAERNTRQLRKRLAFERAAVYEIRTGDERQPLQAITSRSNTTMVTFKEPTGEDARVLQGLQQIDGIFHGLQWHKGPARQDVARLIDLLEKFPEGGYASTLRSALRRFYFGQRQKVSLPDRTKLRELTGITDVHEFTDPRLDAKIEMRFDPTKIKEHDTTISLSLETLLEMLTDQTKVRFDASPYLKRRTISLWTHAVPGWGKPPVNVRDYMDSEWVADRLQAWWVKRGDGYVLIREEDLETAGAQTPK